MCRGSTHRIDDLDEATCYELLRRVRWPQGVRCPQRGHDHVTTHSRFARTPRRRYLCLECRRTFTDLTATPFARTNLPLGAWLRCLALMGQGLSTGELAREVGVKWDTVARMRLRLGRALAHHGTVRDLHEAVRAAPGLARGVGGGPPA